MAEYINRDYTINKIKNLHVNTADKKYSEAFPVLKDAVIKFLENIVPADVVEVVRCKDCIYYKTPHCAIDIWHEDVTIYKAKENDYCSYGKRKDNG